MASKNFVIEVASLADASSGHVVDDVGTYVTSSEKGEWEVRVWPRGRDEDDDAGMLGVAVV